MNLVDIDALKSKFSKHVQISADKWLLTKWNSKEISFRPTHILDDIEKLEREIIACNWDKNKTVLPTQVEITNNILALTGMTEALKRQTGETATTVQYVGVGTDGTAEAEGQTALITEASGGGYARKNLASVGQRKAINQTAHWGVLWDDTTFTVPISLKEGGLFSALTGGVMHARAVFSTFTLNAGDLLVIQINETVANGTL